MSKVFEDRIQKIIAQFASCQSLEDKYNLLLELGRKLPPLPPEQKTLENQVKGCQSTMYLYACRENGNLHVAAEADALISAGLAALLIQVYDHQPLEAVIRSTPDFLDKLGIHGILSPNRSNGLYHIYLRIKQDALKLLIAQ